MGILVCIGNIKKAGIVPWETSWTLKEALACFLTRDGNKFANQDLVMQTEPKVFVGSTKE